MQRLDEEHRSGKWLKTLDARLRPAWARMVREAPVEASGLSDLGPKDPYAEHLGIRFTVISEEAVSAELVVATRHLNYQGSVHPGVLFTMAEAVLDRASNSHGVAASTLDVSASFVASAKVGDRLTATAYEAVLRRRTAVYTVKVFNQHDDLIAMFQGTAIRMA